jgi:DNA-binding beta-propeller fold protein YncE
MNNSSDFPQLSFAIDNVGQPGTIYITTDPSVNKLTFTIATNTAGTQFTAGQLVRLKDAAETTSSLLYLDLSALQIPPGDFQKIVCSAPGWQFQLNTGSIIDMTPTKDQTLNPGDNISVSISNLVLPNPPLAPNLNLPVTFYRVDPITIGDLPQVVFFKVLLQNAPDGKEDLHDAIDCVLTTDPYIVTTIGDYAQVENDLTFALKPGKSPVVVKAGPKTIFIVTFVYAPNQPGYGALTTPQSAVDNIVIAQGENAVTWTVTPDADAQNPSWILQPPTDTPIVGTGIGALVSFFITDIVTRFEPGSTLMYVQYKDVPGYNDGSWTIVLTKIPHVSISDLTLTPNPASISDGEASVTISWKAKDYVSLMLMPFYQDVTQQTSFPAKLKRSTVISLVATGAASGANLAVMTKTADVLPVINSFQVQPTGIYYNDYPHDAKFYWDVDTNDTVLLVEDATKNSETVSKTGTKIVSITRPGMWSLIPQDTSNLYTLLRNVLIQSFKLDAQSNTCAFAPAAAAASPAAEFIAVLDNAGGTVDIKNALDFSEFTTPIPTGGAPVDVVFSHSGTYLFVLNSISGTLTSGSVAAIRITRDAGTGAFTFNLLTSIPFDGQPARIAISDDDRYIFATTSLVGSGRLVIIENTGVDKFSLKQSITLGQSPGGIAVDPSGLNVYVAVAGDNSVAVMGYSSVDDAFTYNRSITNLPQNPVDIAVADGAGKTLLIACPATSKLMIVDYDDDGTSPRQVLDMGKRPIRVSSTPDRAYALIINQGSSDATLVSCYRGTGTVKIVESGIKTGNKPVVISATYDGNSFLLANGENKVLTLNLINYQLRNTSVNIGKQPTNVIATTDGLKTVMWHNALFSGIQPDYTPGIFIYETSSGSVSTRFDNDKIIKCIFDPGIPTLLMYMAKADMDSIAVVETLKFTQKTTIPVPKGEGGVSRFPIDLGISANSMNLYTVTRDASGNYSFLAYAYDTTAGSYSLKTDVPLFTNASTANNVILRNTPDGNNVFVLSTLDKKIWALTRNSKGVYAPAKTQVSLPFLAKTMVASPDNSTLYVLLQQNMKTAIVVVNIPDLSSLEYLFPSSYSLLVNFQQAVISPDGTRLFVTDANTAGVRIISTTTLRVIQTLSWDSVQYPMGIAMQPNGAVLYLTGFNSNNMVMINQIS